MKKKGFTLIELLAVIVVLAVIALIATPIVLNLVKTAKIGAAEQSVTGYVKAVENTIIKDMINNKEVSDGNYKYNSIEADISGKRPTSGKYTVKNGKVESGNFCVDGYTIKYKNGQSKKISDTCEVEYEVYENGTAIYFNPETGKVCDDYVESNSFDENKSGCMRWYTFNDGGSKVSTIDMILDHNTTYKTQWISKEDYLSAGGSEWNYDNNYNTNIYGPISAVKKLNEDTKNWNGVESRKDKYVYNSGSANYTIDYSGMKAKMISGEEIASITGADKALDWSSDKPYSGAETPSVGSSVSYFYFDGSFGTDKLWRTRITSSTNKSKYAWLFDYTSRCIQHGCNVEDTRIVDSSYIFGYWSSSATNASKSNYVYWVYWDHIGESYIHNDKHGLRPVITVSKDIFE